MDGFAETVLRNLAATCSEGAMIFREKSDEGPICALIVPDSGMHTVCAYASEDTPTVCESGKWVNRHRCLAGQPAEAVLSIESDSP